MITLLRKISKNNSLQRPDGLSSVLPDYKSHCALATGRSSINYFIGQIGLNKNDAVLMPAYVAEGVIQPFIENNIQICFYKLDSHLFPDMNNLNTIIENKINIKLCIVIHPMGFEAPIGIISKLLKSKNIYLLEDCAQSLFSKYKADNRPFGSIGDFALFSFNKFLPVLDGATLISNLSEFDLSVDDQKLQPLSRESLRAYYDHLEINKWIAESEDNLLSEKLLMETSQKYDDYYSFINKHLSARKISDYSKNIIKSIDYDNLIKIRKRNTKILYENLKTDAIKFVFKEYNKNIVPMAIPVLFNNCSRNYILTQLKNSGILLSRQESRWNFIFMTDSINDFKHENQFIKKHALVPVNEDISEDEMVYIVEKLNLIAKYKA